MFKNEKSNDPIIFLDNNNIRKDILFFKEEILQDFREYNKNIDTKISKLYQNIDEKLGLYDKHLNSIEFKLIEYSKMIERYKLLKDKIDNLEKFRKNSEDIMLKENIKLSNLEKDLNINIERIDKILLDSVIYTGVIGKKNKYKTFHDLIDYLLTQSSLNSIFREKNILDLKSYKVKIENFIKIFNQQTNKILKTTNEYTRNCIKESEARLKNIISFLEEKIMNTKIENLKYITFFEKYFQFLEKKQLNKKNDKEIYNYIKNNILNHKIEKNKSIKRHSVSPTKNYIIGKINIDNLTKKKQDYKRKSVNALFVKKNKLLNFSHLNKNYLYKLRKSDILQQNIKNSIKDKFTKSFLEE